MRRRGTAALGLACAIALVTAACGTDDEAEGGGGGGQVKEGQTVKVGVLGSLSGPNSSSYPGFKLGVDARLDAYEQDSDRTCQGLDFDVVEGDDQSTESGNLAAAQKLIEQDKVFSIVTASTTLAASTDYLETSAAGVPVIGYPFDGPSEAWFQDDNNFFKVVPIPQQGAVFATTGEFFKSAGATKVASLAFNIEPALVGMRSTADSVKAAGLEDATQYGNIDLSTGDVSGAVNEVIKSGADGVWAAVTPEIGLQLVSALKEAGFDGIVNLPIGYGGDTLKDPSLVTAAQGVYFGTATAPTELETDATKAEAEALKAAGSANDIPTTYETAGYLTADLLIYGIEQAGCEPTSQELMDTLRGTSDYDADGLLPKPLDYSKPEVEELCQFFVKLDGQGFSADSPDPICGDKISG